MSNQLKKDIARNERIVTYILKKYGVNDSYSLPATVYKFVTHLQRDIVKAKEYMSSIAVK